MSGTVGFKNRDRFIQLGIAISTIRKMRGLSQEKLAELAHVSRSHISAIEAPGVAHPFSLEVFYNIADALEVDPADLINASVFSDRIINSKNDSNSYKNCRLHNQKTITPRFTTSSASYLGTWQIVKSSATLFRQKFKW